MRIQHNIMAMSAYRNYTNNVSAMKKNLEKLSSGYKINRAGDDAAGLAISEKMRAQITGLETAQKNAKDGISLVQTAEGALTEVHDMLNRMVELATQSANGTYDDATDRNQLQKEMDQLRSEINRIADSSNFNGIKLLDGSMSSKGTTITGVSRMINEVYTSADGSILENTGLKTFLDGGAASQDVKTKFTVDFTGMTAKPTGGTAATSGTAGTSGTKGQAVLGTGIPTGTVAAGSAFSIGGFSVTINAATTLAGQINEWVTAFNATTATNGGWTAAASGTAAIKFTAEEVGAKTEGPTNITGETLTVTGTAATSAVPPTTGTPAELTFDFKLGGVDIATDVTVTATAGSTATFSSQELAQAILDKITAGANNNDTDNFEFNGAHYKLSAGAKGLEFELLDAPTKDNIKGTFDWDVNVTEGQIGGNHTAGTVVTLAGEVASSAPRANTVFMLQESDIKDGTQITLDGTTITLKVGAKSTTTGDNLVDLSFMEEGSIDMNVVLGKISKAFNGETTNFIVGVNDTKNGDVKLGLTVEKKEGSAKEYKTKEDLGAVFSISQGGGKGLTLQIGDTAEDFNQLKVDIGDTHTYSLGIDAISIADQDSAADAVNKIKTAINKVSDIRGTLGATQNRLDHTINNLSVMTENIQDAESTIRDVDVAEEMMAYTKNNILIQSAQAMLAQANQVPQGVLQLLQ